MSGKSLVSTIASTTPEERTLISNGHIIVSNIYIFKV